MSVFTCFGSRGLCGALVLGLVTTISSVVGAENSSMVVRPTITLSKSNTLERVKCEAGYVATFDEKGASQPNIAGLSRAIITCSDDQPPFKVDVVVVGGVIQVTGGGNQKTFIQLVFQAK